MQWLTILAGLGLIARRTRPYAVHGLSFMWALWWLVKFLDPAPPLLSRIGFATGLSLAMLTWLLGVWWVHGGEIRAKERRKREAERRLPSASLTEQEWEDITLYHYWEGIDDPEEDPDAWIGSEEDT